MSPKQEAGERLVSRFDPETEERGPGQGFALGDMPAIMVAYPDGEWVRYSDYEALEQRLAEVEGGRDKLLSAAKQWRQATESRVKLIAQTARNPESSDIMLHPDKAFIAVIEALSGEQGGTDE